ncbi:hypothetical protein NPIL_494061 [Nephila pilipes]|uniref:Uncharacterized protein n=1 Tax=Nephila pilipes TaxID=299642 RepID=A0A8X6Q395_NEPPI|nr:hypothetical protein NPIL_494061 [Nephila pilipes]
MVIDTAFSPDDVVYIQHAISTTSTPTSEQIWKISLKNFLFVLNSAAISNILRLDILISLWEPFLNKRFFRKTSLVESSESKLVVFSEADILKHSYEVLCIQ